MKRWNLKLSRQRALGVRASQESRRRFRIFLISALAVLWVRVVGRIVRDHIEMAGLLMGSSIGFTDTDESGVDCGVAQSLWSVLVGE